ncbi:hypothetical protein [Desulfobulbus sp.]|uniref:hypothetical protein n=1 Tax=Desulfobulbus sp. TaxID=895 RepID=UPI0027BA8F6D|nr:hypothetical protein [Desulfobulbus sp.]
MKNCTEIEIKYKKRFSICTLVTNFSEYEEMVHSFETAGFSEKTADFFYIDNSEFNHDDGYTGTNKFLNQSNYKYIIICHQDILLKFDSIDVLDKCINEIEELDPNWAILGNAGFQGFTERFYRITDPWGDNRNTGKFPAKVKSLDENFLLVKNESNLSLSHDLSGFHMYGTDLCTIAKILGWNSYVINFHLFHKSAGNGGSDFNASRSMFIKKYQKCLKSLWIRTPCTSLIVTKSRWLNNILNRKFFYSIKKRGEQLKCFFNV